MFLQNKYSRCFPVLPLCLLFTTLFAGGCKKLIDVGEPDNTVTADKVFNSPALANMAMAGIYSQMMSNTGGTVFSNSGTTLYAGMSSDELINFSGTVNTTDYQFYTNHLLVENAAIMNILWKPAYTNIYGANGIIEGINASTAPQMDDSTRKQLIGEAKFVRAFCFFYLTNFFGEIPLTLETDFNNTALMKRSPQVDVYKQIELDLKDAAASLITNYAVSGGERIRPNKWAAKALLARVYLYQKRWAEAEAEASDVIGNTQFILKTNLNDVFLKNSEESIWQLAQNPAVNPYSVTFEAKAMVPTFRWTQLAPADQASFLIPSFFSIYVAYLVPSYYLSDQAMSAYEANDQRRIAWVDSVPSPSAAPYNSYVYHYSLKYKEAVGATTTPIKEYYTVLRLAEQYLIRAEARAQQNTNITGAAADLDAIRKRAGLPVTTAADKDALLAAVAHERQVEFMAEWGHRWFDLKRREEATAVLGNMPVKQPWSNNYLLYPIPYMEALNNPNLGQNKGY